jgi:hypothetical protein
MRAHNCISGIYKLCKRGTYLGCCKKKKTKPEINLSPEKNKYLSESPREQVCFLALGSLTLWQYLRLCGLGVSVTHGL